MNFSRNLCLLAAVCLMGVLQGQANTDSLLRKLENTPEAGRAAIYHTLSSALADEDPAAGLEYATKGIAIARTTNDKQMEALLLNSRGQHYYHFGEYAKAIDDFEASLHLSREAGNKKGTAYSLNNLGNVHSDISNYEEALNFYLDAIKIVQELGDTTAMGSMFTNVGSLYGALGYPEKELEYYRLSLAIAERTGNFALEAITLENMGVVYSEGGKFPEAEDYLRRAIVISARINDLHGVAECQGALADLYFKQGDFTKGGDWFSKSVNNAESIGDRRLVCENYTNIATAYTQQGQYDRAQVYAEKALAIAKELNHLPLQQRAYDILARRAVANGDYKAAYTYFRKYEALKDSLFKAQKTRTVTELEIKFQVERRKQEITFLHEKNEQQQAVLESERKLRIIYTVLFFTFLAISVFVYKSYLTRKRNEEALRTANARLLEQEKSLRELNAAKDKIFSIIGHDLRSPLFILTGLADILREEYPDIDPGQARQIIDDLSSKAHTTSGLLENLLAWGRSQSEGVSMNRQAIRIHEAVEECITIFSETSSVKQIRLSNEAASDLLLTADRDMLLVILRNLISNAIKFSHPGGKVRIYTKDNGDSVSLCVADEGAGIPEERLQRLFDITKQDSTRGTMNEKGTGLGLLLCKEFAERMGGSIAVESTEGAGSTFICTLPQS